MCERMYACVHCVLMCEYACVSARVSECMYEYGCMYVCVECVCVSRGW